MIEIIREESWDDTKEKKLPKDIRQIGKPDVGERIYIEDEAYKSLHPYDNLEEKTVYVLLGKFENYNGRQCTFVEAVIQLEQLEFEGEIPRWSDHEWAFIYKKLKDEYDNMVIVGWAFDHRGCLPNMTKQIETFHQTHFGGIHQILFLMDTLEQEETFYSVRNGHLYRRDGFYIYYDKAHAKIRERTQTEKMQPGQALADTQEKETFHVDVTKEKAGLDDALEESNVERLEKEWFRQQEKNMQAQTRHSEKNLEEEEQLYREESEPIKQPKVLRNKRRQGNYRKQFEQSEEARIPAYSSMVLAVVVLTLGLTAYQNHKKMNEMESTLAQMNQVHITTEALETESTVKTGIVVENIAGTVEKQTQETDLGQMPQQSETDSETQSQETPSQEDADGGASSESAQAQGEPETDISSGETAQPSDMAENQSADTDTQIEEQPKETAAAEAGSVPSYLQQGYYVVQQGDSLAAICKKVYQTTAMMDKVCEVNGIDNPDSIYAGQYLTLPN